jgi:hypothetical protein
MNMLNAGPELGVWNKGGRENCDLTAQNNAILLIYFYIIETLYTSIPFIIVNSDHAVEASMLN